jgi:site-specific recombinase XerD
LDFDDRGNSGDERLPQGKNLPVIAKISPSFVVPQQISNLGYHATLRFLDFFTANIRNKNTRAAYAVAVRSFFMWLDGGGVTDLRAVRTHHVAAYIERLAKTYKAPTVKQHLAAIRMLFDWLIVGQVVEQNPAAAVRGPKHVVKKAKPPSSTATKPRS